MIDSKKIKSDFPIFKNYPRLVYLDNASTSQKPQVVIDAVSDFYTKYNANIRRGIYKLSGDASKKYEEVRDKIAKFINAQASEIIFTKNTNEAINLISQGFAKSNFKKGDIIVISEMEHHANIVPWIRLKEEIGIELYYIPLTLDFKLDYKKIATSGIDFSKIKLVSITYASNVLGTINPIKEITAYFKGLGINASFCIDAAQSIAHVPINIIDLGCDFLVFSSHKMLGPSGVGVLWAKNEILEQMSPFLFGSNMISEVRKDSFSLADIPSRFEAGTANLEGVYGLGAAIDYLINIGMENIFRYDQFLSQYGLEVLSKIEGLKIYGPQTTENRLAIFSFALGGVHPHDIAQILDEENIAIRSGHHCAQILMDRIKEAATARASAYIYNCPEDIDALVKGIKRVKKILKV